MTAAGYSTCFNVADGFEGPLDAQGQARLGGGMEGERDFHGDKLEPNSIADIRQQ